LAICAVQHIEDEEAPLFLRFVNLLVNDAIFLLDEALSYMKQMQEQEIQRADWQQLPHGQRSQNEAQFNHVMRLARYHNIMGMETIGLLALFTSSIHEVFSHATMVDRIAAMLNYFLKSLVGSERNTFKVKNLEQYEFR
jgi:ubiquitin conjugation factor E4 A